MPNYSCTVLGCSADTGGLYTSLANCEEACFSWGCPNSVSLNANLYFIYDSSGSFTNNQVLAARSSVNNYLAGLTNDGWQGDYYHIKSPGEWLDLPRRIFWGNNSFQQTPNIAPGLFDNEATWGTFQSPTLAPLNNGVNMYTANTIIVVFTNEATTYHHASNTLAGSTSWYATWSTGTLGTYPGYSPHHFDYISKVWDPTVLAAGSVSSVLIPVTTGVGTQTQTEKNFVVQALASISSGNQNLTAVGGSGNIDGTWIKGAYTIWSGSYAPGTSPSLVGLTNGSQPQLCLVTNTSLVQAWWAGGDGLEYYNTIYATGYGGLDQKGWSIDPTFGDVSSATLADNITNMIGTVSNAATICLSAQTSVSTNFPYTTQLSCDALCFGGGCMNPTAGNYDPYANLDCALNPSGSTAWSAAGTYGDESCCWNDPHKCTADGCVPFIPQPGTTFYDSLEECITGCTTYECSISGCGVFNLSGTSTWTGIGNYGTGGTYNTMAACTGVCVSYSCTTTGCTLYNDSGSTSWLGYGHLGTGGTWTGVNALASCTGACQSWNCTDTGCEPYNGGSGTGGTFTEQVSCTTICTSWNCTDYGCMEQPGTGGTFSSLNACSAACQSWECTTGGCQTWNNPTGTTAQSYIAAGSYGTPGFYGTGGTATYNGCTGTCYSWECSNVGCVKNIGSALGTYAYNEWSLCDLQCRSMDCGVGGCFLYNNAINGNGLFGTGGTYNGPNPVQECNAECKSFNCEALTPNNPPTNNTEWITDSCVSQFGTGGTFFSGILNPTTIADSLAMCQTGCTSWSCQNPYASTAGCLEYPNTGNTLSQDSYTACTATTICQRFDCTATGCVVGDPITGSFSDYASCTGSCQSWGCTTTGCTLWNVTGTSSWIGSGHLGTGGTYDNNVCDSECNSWNCENNGCNIQIGTGGTYTIALDGITAPYCNNECESWNCTDNGCDIQPGTGGTYTDSTCGGVCTSWNCDDFGCTSQTGTGGTYSSLASCTGTCVSYNCTDTGCPEQNGTGGTFVDLITCTGVCDSYNCSITGCDEQLGTGGTYTQVLFPTTYTSCDGICTSWNCGPSGCVPLAGNGGAYPDLFTCSASCESWNCINVGCITQYGTGGTYTTELYGGTANVCDNECNSWDCTNTGCEQYNVPGLGGTGGTYDNSSCDNVCISYECLPFGCQAYGTGIGTGGTYSTSNCDGICVSWECLTNGCGAFNGGDGSGGTYTVELDCTTACTSYNCFPTGCTIYTGFGGTYPTAQNCLQDCDSYNCSNTGCSQYNVFGSPTYVNGSGGTLGAYTTMGLCDTTCVSWNCTNTGCEPHNAGFGTGGTYTYLLSLLANVCDNVCESWDCAYVPLPSGFDYSTTPGCTQYLGTAYTFSTSTACDDGCASFTCLGLGAQGCLEFPNTASTYTDYNSCTASTDCKYYDCTINGCVQVVGEYTGGIDSYQLKKDCDDNCIGWGCVSGVLATGTTIYVYYDTTEYPGNPSPAYTYGTIGSWRDEIENYISTTFPTWAGTMYHTIVSDGNWLDWANSIYSGEFRVAPGNPAFPTYAGGVQVPSNDWDENALHSIKYFNSLTAGQNNYGNWHDQYSGGTYTNITTTIANPDTSPSGVFTSITTQGIAPTAHTSGDTLVISVFQKASGVELNPLVNGYHNETMSGNIPYMASQPTTAWTTDYTAHTTNYLAVSAASGTFRGVLFPVWAEGNTANVDLNRMCMLQALAAVKPGNNTPQDGMYQVGTAPQLVPHQNVGGIGTDFNMSQLEVGNPYWTTTTPTYGNLEAKGWAVDITVLGAYCVSSIYATTPACWTGAGHLIGQAIDNQLQLTSPTVGDCLSAETLYTVNTTYPFATSAVCESTCAPQYYACTNTGCTLSWTGTMSLANCQSVCKSVHCTNSSSIGCEWYNSPGSTTDQNGLYGTGGTFTGGSPLTDCQSQCFSYDCDPVPNYVTGIGCQQYIGTGSTYSSYSNCTGDCRSWECDDPCVVDAYNVSIGLGCIEYANTGATYSALTACTGTCQENWYCTTADTIDSCYGLTYSTVTSGDIDDHIDMLSFNPVWNNILFQDFKFLYITTPTNAINTCYSGSPANAYWTKVNSITITLTSTLPVSVVAYSWNDVTDFMDIHYPLTTISTISDIENIGGVTLTYDWELCSCIDVPCTIGCTGTTIPVTTVGPYTSHTQAQLSCCTATTWSCATNTIIDDCDGLTLIPGLFTDAEGCYEWLANQGVGTYALDVTTLKCEVMPSVPLAQCELGPNNGQLIRLTGVTSSIAAISSNNYTSLTSYVSALQGISVPNAVVGLPLDVLHAEVQLVYVSAEVYYGWADCECDNPYTCGCVELFDGTGPYTSKTQCELFCCTATTWNCVTGTEYLPICSGKTNHGYTNDTTSLLEYYRINSQLTLFGVDTWAITSNPPLTWTQVQTNMALAGPPWVWQQCYDTPNGSDYYPLEYLYTISHPLISGGTLYQTWDDFYTAVSSVVTILVSDTIAGINTKINTHFNTTAFNVLFDIKSCCSDDDCYCYDTLHSSGSYANELLCDSSCCPSDTLSWSCELDSTGSYGCTYGYYGPPIVSPTSASNGPWASISDCQFWSLECSTSWECDGTTSPCPCVEVQGHYTITGNYPTEWDCDNNTNINDCCGLLETYTCQTGTFVSNMTGLSVIPVTGTVLGYLTTDDVLTYIADPLTSPTNQTSGITNFSFCLEEHRQTILNNLPAHCKCGDGCNGVLHYATGFTLSHFNLGSTDTTNAFDIVNYPYGYCTTWVDFIDQINIVWAPGIVSVNLTMTYQQVVNEVQNGIGVTQFGVGTISCVDSSSPCGCVAVFDGSGVSLSDCSSSCCTETITYTCTLQGCKSRCDGTGEYQTLQECEVECWEWRCNQDIWGCTDPSAFNYNPLATIDDGSCILPNDYWSCGYVDSCSDRAPIAGGLSFTAAIHSISNTPSLHSVTFDLLKYDLGGGNSQPHPTGLPCEPCEVPGQTGGQPGPYYAYIKYVMYSGLGTGQFTSWSSFIDAINNLGYSFVYTNSWQDLEAVLGQTQLHCAWDWCDCSGARTCVPDTNGNYISSGQCYADVNNLCTSWKCDASYVESCSGSTTFMGPFTNFGHVEDDYISTYPTIDTTVLTFSMATIPLSNTGYWASLGFTPCTPPVQSPPIPLSMFPLLQLTGVTVNPSTILAGLLPQITFTSWLATINAINALGLAGLTVNIGMDSATLSLAINNAGYGCTNCVAVAVGWGYCICGWTNCNCVEVPDGTGPYPSITCCESDEGDDNCCYINWDCPGTP